MFDPFKTRDSRNSSARNAPVWALLIGETYASAVHAQARRRPHPGMLPDVDFSPPVLRASRPSLLRRAIELARAANEATGSFDDLVGDMRSSYIAHATVADCDHCAPDAVRPLAA